MTVHIDTSEVFMRQMLFFTGECDNVRYFSEIFTKMTNLQIMTMPTAYIVKMQTCQCSDFF